MTTSDRTSLVLFFGAVASRLGFHLFTQFVADDAYITYRYAENLASGLGFVYNEGERVLGTTTPLFTFVLALARLLHFPVVETSLFISLVASGITAVLIYRYAQLLRFGALSWLPALCYLLWPRSLPAEMCGMESSLFTCLCLAAFYTFRRGLDYYAIGFATLATLVRPEGILLLIVLGLTLGWQNRRRLFAYAAVAGSLLLPWVAFATWYFGSPLPNSISGKLALYEPGMISIADRFIELLGWHQLSGIAMTPLVVWGAVVIWNKIRFGIPELLWLFAMYLFFGLLAPKLFFWYHAPFAPFYLLLLCAPLLWGVVRFRLLQTSVVWLAPLIVIAAATGLYRTIPFYADYQHALDSMHKQIGIHLRMNAEKTDLVAAEDIGYMGYYSKARILDRDGLVSPVVHPYNRRAAYGEVVTDMKPDWVVVAKDGPFGRFVSDSSFMASYDVDSTFSWRNLSYSVYRRNENEMSPGN